MADETKDRFYLDITTLIEAITTGITYHYVTLTRPDEAPDKDAILMALQMLSILCCKSWSYTDEQIDDIWRISKRDYTNIDLSDELNLSNIDDICPIKTWQN